MAVDVIRIRCPVVVTRVAGAGSRCLQVGPAQRGLGEALPAAGSRCRLRVVDLARPRFRRRARGRPGSQRRARSDEVVRRLGHLAAGVAAAQPRSALSSHRRVRRCRDGQRRRAGPGLRKCGSPPTVFFSDAHLGWRLCASTAHGPQRRRPACAGKVDDRHWRQRRAGRAIEHRKAHVRDAEVLIRDRRQHPSHRYGKGGRNPAVSKNPGTHVRAAPGPGRSPCHPAVVGGVAEERRNSVTDDERQGEI